ncbi:MAG: sigma-70 family RNA polymerase sigma factor [Bacteroidetes bacterium]|nr:sigma-70 family RNA polymerase sigma factor [Bacteroidota bacterium]
MAPVLQKTIKRSIYGIPSYLVKDILQDIMVKIFMKLNTFKQGNSLNSWAISIAVHHAIDLSRKRKPNVVFSEDIEIYNSSDSESLVDSYQFETYRGTDIFELSNKYLDEKSKHFITGKYLSGLKQKELSEKMKIPIGSISGLQSQAIGQLRTKISALRLDRSNFL